MINFDKVPDKKPNSNASAAPGRHLAVVDKVEIKATKEGREYLQVTFKTKDSGSFNEFYFDGDKPFLMYKIGRLLKATGVVLEGTGTLQDLAKLVKGKKVIVDVIVDDKGYANLDYSDNKEGVYARDEVVMDTVEVEPELDEDVQEAIASDDDDF
jgi:hypothetical protein